MSDGGEDTIDVYKPQYSYQLKTITVVNPIVEKIKKLSVSV